MQMIRWMCGISLKDRMTNEELKRLVGVEPITPFIRSGRLRWYGHVMTKGDEDWVKKCMEYRVEGRRPVGRPSRMMCWGGRLFLKGDRRLDLFCFTKLLTVWQKCPSKASLSRRIRVLEENTA